MRPMHFLSLLMLVTVCAASFLYLIKKFIKAKQLIPLVGLFGMTMGVFLLLLDLLLITFTHGPQYIPDYLLFNRPVFDSGFAGRWILTVYVFISAGPVISIYLLARTLISKFNNTKQAKT